jgi:hypothetical protein
MNHLLILMTQELDIILINLLAPLKQLNNHKKSECKLIDHIVKDHMFRVSRFVGHNIDTILTKLMCLFLETY